jgi:RHS repeat-associated protein
MRIILARIQPVARESYITNLDGEIVQHVEYLPFGEVFIEERNNSWNTPYLFNSKELDEETGLYYYGARYYNPRESVWLSVDPLFEKTMTPYQYTYQNPLKYTDPTGMKGEDWVQQGSRIIWDEEVTSKNNTKPGQTYIGKNDEDVLNYLGVNQEHSINEYKFGSISTLEGNNAVTDWTRLDLNGNVRIGLDKQVNNSGEKEVVGVNIRTSFEYIKSSHGAVQIVTGGKVDLEYGYDSYSKTLGVANSMPPGVEAIFNIPLNIALKNRGYQKCISANVIPYSERDNIYTPVVKHPIIPIPVSFKRDSGKGGGLIFGKNRGLPLNSNKNAKHPIRF